MTPSLLSLLRKVDTPTVCNAIDQWIFRSYNNKADVFFLAEIDHALVVFHGEIIFLCQLKNTGMARCCIGLPQFVGLGQTIGQSVFAATRANQKNIQALRHRDSLCICKKARKKRCLSASAPVLQNQVSIYRISATLCASFRGRSVLKVI